MGLVVLFCRAANLVHVYCGHKTVFAVEPISIFCDVWVADGEEQRADWVSSVKKKGAVRFDTVSSKLFH